MVCIWIVLTRMFIESMLVLKQQWKGPDVSFVSSLNSFVTRSRWIVEKTYPVKLTPNPFSFSLLNHSFSSFLRSSVYVLECAIMRVILMINATDSNSNIFSTQRCRSISDSVTDGTNETSLKLILCTIKLMSQHF